MAWRGWVWTNCLSLFGCTIVRPLGFVDSQASLAASLFGAMPMETVQLAPQVLRISQRMRSAMKVAPR